MTQHISYEYMALKKIIFLECKYRCESVSVCAAMTTVWLSYVTICVTMSLHMIWFPKQYFVANSAFQHPKPEKLVEPILF